MRFIEEVLTYAVITGVFSDSFTLCYTYIYMYIYIICIYIYEGPGSPDFDDADMKDLENFFKNDPVFQVAKHYLPEEKKIHVAEQLLSPLDLSSRPFIQLD